MLGPFQAQIATQPVGGFAYDKVRALLAFLAIECHQPHTREWLATLLWPDSSPDTGRTSLRKALSTLRKAICDDDASSSYLLIDRESVQFNPESNYWLDVAEVNKRLDASLDHPHLQLDACKTCVCDLEEATTLYRGDFLQGLMVDSLEFEEWSLTIREHLHSRMLTALHHLTTHYLHRGEYSQAQKFALRQVGMEPYREEAHRVLMQCLVRSGQRSAALAQFERCRRILDEELGVEPSAETRALYERIRSAGETCPHNIPALHYPLVGRESELQEIGKHLANPDCRLLTLVGMGGIGKTSLALQAAQEQRGVFLHGIYFVPLAAIESSESIVPTIADALSFRFAGPRPLDVQLLDFIGAKDLLLVLDNFEHLENGAEIINRLMEGAPYLKLIVTSRERLRLRSEWIVQIEGLTCPPGKDIRLDNLEKFSGVQCFIAIANRLSPGLLDFQENRLAVARICTLTGGVPLGIELAASWVDQFSPAQIADEIEKNLDTLTTTMRDVPLRQRSMRAAFNYSWALLSPEEQDALQRLAIFQGGFDGIAARQVTGARSNLLEALVDKNLIKKREGARFEIHSLINQFAAEKLVSRPELENITRDQHGAYFTAFLADKAVDYRREKQQKIFDVLDIEYNNLQSAWRHAIQADHLLEVDKALEGLFLFYELRSRFREGQVSLERALTGFREKHHLSNEQLRTLGRLLTRLGRFYIYLGQQDRAKELLLESLEILEKFPATMEYASSLGYLGIICHYRGQYQQAEQYAQESLYLSRQINNQDGEAFSLNLLGNLAQAQGDYVQAQDYFQQNLTIREAIKDIFGIAIACNNLGNLAHAQGELVDAQRLYERSYASFEQINHTMGMATGLSNAGYIAMKLGESESAREMLERSLLIKRDLGQQIGVANTLTNLGELACQTGEFNEAENYFRDAMRIAVQVKAMPLAVELLVCFANLFVKQEKREEAVGLLVLADTHPAGKHETKARVAELLLRLENLLPSDVYKAAQNRGKELELEVVARSL
jgi:predicted ATPase/DNA-binding SARP family transcriptional activator/uncharacterized protein HemY